MGNLGPQLLRAAREVLDEAGPTKISLRTVAKRVGVSPTAAYHHYASRAELFGKLATAGFRDLAALLDQRIQAAPSGQALPAAAQAYFEFARANPSLYLLMFGPEFAVREEMPELRAAAKEAYAALERTIAAHLERDIESEEVGRAAFAAWSFAHGLSSIVIQGVHRLPEDLSDTELVEQTLQGFADLFGRAQAS